MKKLAAVAAFLMLLPAAAFAGLKPLDGEGAEAAPRAEPVMAYHEKLVEIGAGTVEPLFSADDFATPASECRADHKPRTFGLLIGAASPGPRNMQLQGPENDVRLIATALQSSGAAEADVRSLVGPAATREGLRAAALTVAEAAGCDDRVVIYFGGHSGTPDASIISDAVATARERAGGTPLQNALIYAEGDEALRVAAAIHWHRKSGLILFLNGDGQLGRDAQTGLFDPAGFDLFTAADLAQLAIALRNRGADVAAILDTNFASEAGLMERQREAAAGSWSADISAAEPAKAAPSPFDSMPLAANAGEFAVLYSSIGQSASVEMAFGEADDRTTFGEFTFRISNALQNRTDLTVRGLADSLRSVAGSNAGPDSDPAVRHRIEATDPDMPIFADISVRPPPSKAIRILKPTPKRGAAKVDKPEVEIAGRVEWPAQARVVWIEGKEAILDPQGGFSGKVALKPGLNEIDITAMTADWRTHEARLEFVFNGDKQALEGEGRRFAVIIANQNYGERTGFAPLQTPFADAEALAEILVSRFGFEIEAGLPDGRKVPLFLKDATGRDIQTTLHMVNLVAGEKDTVLVFYAGHGIYENVTTTAFWVPVDAEAGVPFSYLSASAISEQLQRMVAGNIILISDSCYSGALLRGGGSVSESTAEQDRMQMLLRLAGRRSRILISSGGNEPVEDLGGDGHSVFAKALLAGLEEMPQEAFSARELFDQFILPMVVGHADQEPQYRPIEKSGHDGGDVVFVRLDGQDEAAAAE